MKILDYQNLVHPGLLHTVTKHHPLYSDLASEINILYVQEKDHCGIRCGIRIEMDQSANVTLTIHPIIRPSERDKYILYHEFGHIADRLNPYFGYNHEKRLNLSQAQEECFMQIWNVFIDARLHHHGLFRLPPGGEVDIVVDGTKYRLPRTEVSTYLLEASAHLSQRGIRKPGALVTGIWNYPTRFLTFEDLLAPLSY
jgi:hypothetical protein